VADALSRIETVVESIATPVSPQEIAEAQVAEENFDAIRQQCPGLKLERVPIPGSDVTLMCDVSEPTRAPSCRRRSVDGCSSLSMT